VADIEYYGTGRRKTSTARVYLRPGGGNVVVNRKSFDAYFPNETHRMIIRQPLNLTETTNKFDVLVNVAGGGPSGQAGAIRHGITRALMEYNADLRPALKQAGYQVHFLTLANVDPATIARFKPQAVVFNVGPKSANAYEFLSELRKSRNLKDAVMIGVFGGRRDL